jgi:hypothetical protein
MSNIADLVKSKTNAAGAAIAKVEKQRFMLVLDDKTREDLRSLAEELGVKQINFASELFTVALTDAMKTFREQKAAATSKAPAAAK